MPRKSKRPSRGDRPAAERPLASAAPVRQFVDREELIAAFRTALQETGRTEPKVLVYHGGAGIGKSRLRRELVWQMADDTSVVTADLDFAIPSYRQTESALLFLRNTIRETYRVSFPSFDLAYAVLWQKAHPDTPLGDELKPLLEPGSLLSQLLDETGKLPLIGLIPRVSKLLAKPPEPPHCQTGAAAASPGPLDPFLSTWWVSRGERELEDLPQMEPVAIVECLPKLWAADIKDYLSDDTTRRESRGQSLGAAASNSLRDSPHLRGHVPARRAVLFIDSYEQLWGTADGGRKTEDGKQTTDVWVRGLVKQLPEVLWVICGRQRLRWEEAEKEWVDVLSQHELGPLSEHSARQFLSSCGITNEPIQDAIVKGSQGVPHYLDLAVDTFLEIKRAGQRVPVEVESASTPEGVFAQFIRHLNQPQVKTLQILSASRFWYYGLFEHLVTEYQTGYPLSAYDDLSRFSFIRQSDSGGTQMMHELMREALQEHQAPELRKRVHLFLHELYAKQLQGLDVKGITDKHKTALTEAFYHGRQAKSAAELWSWFEPTARVFHDAYQCQLVAPLYRAMVQVLETELGPNHADTATSLWRLAIELLWLGEYDEAEPLFRRALAIAESGSGPEHPHYLEFLSGLVGLLTRRGRYDEAEVLGRRLVGKVDSEPGRDAASRAYALDDLACVLTHQRKYAEAEDLFRRELVICESQLGSDHKQTAKALSSFASLYFEWDRPAESASLERRALAIYERLYGANSPQVADHVACLAAALRDSACYAEAEPLFRRALKFKEETYGPDHDTTALTLNNLACLLGDTGRHAEAEPLLRRALASFEKRMGPDHPYTFRMASTLAYKLAQQSKHAEAEPMALNLVADREKRRGPDHPETAHALAIAGSVYRFQGRYAEAESYMRRALATWTRALGPENHSTLATLDALALLEEQQGRYAEAETLCRDVLEKRARVLGPDYPSVATTANRLAGLCGRGGRYAEAEAFYRRALAIREKVFGPDHAFVAEPLEGLAKVCEQTGRTAEAQELSARAKSIRDKNAEPQTPT